MAWKTDIFPQIESVSALEGNRIDVSYKTGERRIFDVSPYIKGSWFGELADPVYFSRVSVDPQFGDTVVWPHGQDLAPHEVYELGAPA